MIHHTSNWSKLLAAMVSTRSSAWQPGAYSGWSMALYFTAHHFWCTYLLTIAQQARTPAFPCFHHNNAKHTSATCLNKTEHHSLIIIILHQLVLILGICTALVDGFLIFLLFWLLSVHLWATYPFPLLSTILVGRKLWLLAVFWPFLDCFWRLLPKILYWLELVCF